MAPDKKLEWFRENDFPEAKIEEVKEMAIERWNKSYESLSSDTSPSTPSEPQGPTQVCSHFDRCFAIHSIEI